MTKLYIILCFSVPVLITLLVISLGVLYEPLLFGLLVLLPYSLMYVYDSVVYDLRKAVKRGLRKPKTKDSDCKSSKTKDDQWSIEKFPDTINYSKEPIPASSIMSINRLLYNWGSARRSTKSKHYGHNIYVNTALAYMMIVVSNISLFYVLAALASCFIIVLLFTLLKDSVYKHGPKALAKRCNDIAHTNGWYNPYRISMKSSHLNKSYKYDIK